jgi:hypothetical protein
LKLVVVKREERARIQQRRQEQRHQQAHDVRDVIDDLMKVVICEERTSAASVAQSAHADTASSAMLVEDNTSADIQEAAARKKDEAVIDTGARDPPLKIMSPSSDDTPQIPNATPVIRCEAAAPEIGNPLLVALSNAATEHALSFAGDARASRLYVLRAGPSGGGRAADIEDAKGPAIRKMEGAVNDQVGCDANGLLALCDVGVEGCGSSFEAASSEVEERTGKKTEFCIHILLHFFCVVKSFLFCTRPLFCTMLRCGNCVFVCRRGWKKRATL